MKNKNTLILVIIILILPYHLFSAENIPGETQNNQAQNSTANSSGQSGNVQTIAKKKTFPKMNLNYLMAGMGFYAAHQDAYTDPPDFDDDVKFFAYDIVVDFNYIFRHVELHINFEYSNFKTKIHHYKSAAGEYTDYEKWKRKTINFTLGYAVSFSHKYMLVCPAIGFGYKRLDNPGTQTDHESELYYLIFAAKFFINIKHVFTIGFDLEFRLLLSHMAYYEDPTDGQGHTILRKGVYFYFRLPMKINISEVFFISIKPFISIFHSPETNANFIAKETGIEKTIKFHKMFLYKGGVIVSFGVNF